MEPSVAWPSSVGTMRGFLFLKKKNIGADSWKNVLVEYDPNSRILTVTKVDNGGSLVFRKVVTHAVAVRPKLNRRRFRFDVTLEVSSSPPTSTQAPLPSQRGGNLIACFAAANSHEYTRWLTALHTSAQEAVTSCNTSRNNSLSSFSSDHSAALLSAVSQLPMDRSSFEAASRSGDAHNATSTGSGVRRDLRTSSGDEDTDRFQGLALADLPEEEEQDSSGRLMGHGSSAGSGGSWASEEERRGEERAEQQRAAGVGLGGIDETPAWRRSLAERELGPSSGSFSSTDSHGGRNNGAPILVDYNDDDPELTTSTGFVEVPQRLMRNASHEARLPAAACDALVNAATLATVAAAEHNEKGNEKEEMRADGVGGTSVGSLLEAAALPDKELSLFLSSSGSGTKASKLKPASKKVVTSFRAAVARLPVRSYSVELRSPGSGVGGKFVTVHGVPETELRRCRLSPLPPRSSPAGIAPPPPLRAGAYANPPLHDSFIPGDVVSVEFHREAAESPVTVVTAAAAAATATAAATANPANSATATSAPIPKRELARVCSEDLIGQAALVVGENHSFDANSLGLRLVRQLAWRGAKVACSVPGPILPTSLVALQRAGRVLVAVALNGEDANPSISKSHHRGGKSSSPPDHGLVGQLRRAGLGQLNLVLMLPPELAPNPHLAPTPPPAVAAAAPGSTTSAARTAAHGGLLGLGALELERSLQNAFDQHAVAPVAAVVALHNQGLLCTDVDNTYKSPTEHGVTSAGVNTATTAASNSAAVSPVRCRVGVLVPDLTDPLRPWCGDVGVDHGAILASSTGYGRGGRCSSSSSSSSSSGSSSSSSTSNSAGRADHSLVGHLASHRVGRAALLMGVRLLGHELSEATNGSVCVAALSPTTVQSHEVFANATSVGIGGGSDGAKNGSLNPRAMVDRLVSVLAGLKLRDAGGLIRADGSVLYSA